MSKTRNELTKTDWGILLMQQLSENVPRPKQEHWICSVCDCNITTNYTAERVTIVCWACGRDMVMQPDNKKCRWCGQDFKPESGTQQFCDASCWNSYEGIK